MNTHILGASITRILQQLRHDPRTIGLLLVVPVVLMSLVYAMFAGAEPFTSNVLLIMLGLFPFTVMFLITSIATLRERRTGTLERLLAMPLGKGDLLAGYALAKYRFPGRNLVFNLLIGGILVPAVVLAIPQYLLLSKAGLADTYWSVLLPQILSPYGIYLARIYAAAAVPDALVEAARIDGAGHGQIFFRVALPLMTPGLVTVFLFQFTAIWNNFLLPFIMLGDDRAFPLTVGLYTLLAAGANQPSLYNLILTGAMLSIIPLVALFLTMQRYWRTDLSRGAVKS